MCQPSTPRICILGAGFAGLTVAIQLKRTLGWNSFTIYEKNAGIGGAWFQNTYPGAECDYPSHFYSWSFEPNSEWTCNYASQAEVLEYMEMVVEKYEISDNLKLKTQVESVSWNETINNWCVVSKELETGRIDAGSFEFVFSGVNFLWQPNKPKEFEAFAGPCIHAAEWDHSVILENKIVGVVGTGSSAVQVIPSIAPRVQELHSFQRDPAWVLPKPLFKYSPLCKWAFRNIPFVMKLYRWFLFWQIAVIAKALIKGSRVNKFLTKVGTHELQKQCAGNPALFENILPETPFACKVPSLSSTYIPALASEKVKVHRSQISYVTKTGIVTANGEEIQLDVLILATGFKSQEFFGPMQIIGPHNKNVLQIWQNDRPRNYLGTCCSLTPNFFFIGGPYGILTTSTAMFAYECEVNYATQILAQMFKQQKHFVLVKKSAEDESMKELDEAMSFSVIADNANCGSSWIKNAKGYVTTAAPYSAFEFYCKLRNVDYSKFDTK